MSQLNQKSITPEMQSFLLWFLNLEEVSLSTRRDMCQHLIQVGTIDEKTYHFIEEKCLGIIVKSAIKQKELENQLKFLSNHLEAESNPKTSHQVEIAERAGTIMELEATTFATEAREWKKEINQLEEASAQNAEQTNIADLKAQL